MQECDCIDAKIWIEWCLLQLLNYTTTRSVFLVQYLPSRGKWHWSAKSHSKFLFLRHNVHSSNKLRVWRRNSWHYYCACWSFNSRTNTRFLAMQLSTTTTADRQELVCRRRRYCYIMKCAVMEDSMVWRLVSHPVTSFPVFDFQSDIYLDTFDIQRLSPPVIQRLISIKILDMTIKDFLVSSDFHIDSSVVCQTCKLCYCRFIWVSAVDNLVRNGWSTGERNKGQLSDAGYTA